MMDSLLGQRYEVQQEIGRGGYGRVCTGFDHKKGKKVAIKLEKVDELEGEVSSLKKEEEVYSKLKGEESIGITNIHQFGADLIDDDPDNSLEDNGYILHYMVMDLLGPDLEELFAECSQKFTLKTVLLLADQMIRIIQYVHSKDYIHGDIKPGNFVLGLEKTCNMIYMVDFGLAQRYRDSQTKEHIAYSDTASYRGTTRFTSLNCHHCIQKSRRDDLESLGYVLLYFLRGSLPWQGLEDWYDKREKRQLVYEKKASISIEELCTGLPCEFVSYMEYCRSLLFDEEPNYDYLRKLFQDLYDQSGFTDVVEYDWTVTLRSQYMKYYNEDIPVKYMLKQHSSEMKLEDIFYFLNLEYKPIVDPYLCLDSKSTEQCLEQLLKFASAPESYNPQEEFKWFGKSMDEIKQYCIDCCPQIGLIDSFDTLDWKTASETEKNKKLVEMVNIKKTFVKENSNSAWNFMKHTHEIYMEHIKLKETLAQEEEKAELPRPSNKKIPKTSNRNGTKKEVIKCFFENLATVISAGDYLKKGTCDQSDHTITLQEQDDKLSNCTDRSVTVEPDGVYCNNMLFNSKFVDLWGVVLEVYGSHSDVSKKQKQPSDPAEKKSSPTADSVSTEEPPAKKARSFLGSSTSSDSLFRPKYKQDIICQPAFRKSIREYIERSLPKKFNPFVVKKMAGEHVLQLFAQVNQNSNLRSYTDDVLSEEDLWINLTDGIHGYISKDGVKFQKAIGMFVVNEIIYFSRLDISRITYRAITSAKNPLFPYYHKQHPPQVSFANFHLDITKANHRLALVLFIRAYLYSVKDNTWKE